MQTFQYNTWIRPYFLRMWPDMDPQNPPNIWPDPDPDPVHPYFDTEQPHF